MINSGKLISIILIAITLSSCGSGGGGSVTAATINPPGGYTPIVGNPPVVPPPPSDDDSSPVTSPVTFNASYSNYINTVNSVISTTSVSAIIDASQSDIDSARAFIKEYNKLKESWDTAHDDASTETKLSWYTDSEYRNARKIINWLTNEVLPIAEDFADDGKFEDENVVAVEDKISNNTHLDPYDGEVDSSHNELCQQANECGDNYTFVVNYTDSESITSTSSNGTATTVTEVISTRETSETATNGDVIKKTYTSYKDTVTTPVTTTTTTTTTRTNNWSDGTTENETLDVTSTTSTDNTVAIATREELTNTTITAYGIASISSETATTTSESVGNPSVTTSKITEDRTSTDANGSTVVKTFDVYTDTTTVTTTTTVTKITTTTTTFNDGSTSESVGDPVITTSTDDTVTTATREELTNTTVTPNVVSTSDSDSTTAVTTEGTSVIVTTSITEDRTSTDANGSTVVKTYTIYTDTTTTPNATVTTVTTTRTTLWTDGSSTSEVINVVEVVANKDIATVVTREVLTNTTVTPNIVSVSDNETTSSTSTDSSPVTTTTSVNETRTSTDENGSTVTSVYKVYTDTSTVTTTTVTTITTTRVTLWTDGASTSEVISVSSSSATNDTATTSTREELTSTVVTPNIASTSTSNGSATITTSTTENRTSTDSNGSTVTKTYTIYTDTTTVTTTKTTLWTDGSSTSEVIDNTVTTTTREELTNTTITPNVASTSTVYKNERTTTSSSELISELYGTNSDTITVGTDANGNPIQQAVTLYYYSWHRAVSSTTLKDKYTRTTYTDGSVVDSLVTADIVSDTTTIKEYLLDPWGGKKTTTQRVPVGETFVGNPVAPGDSNGSSGVYTYAQRDANHSISNYDATTYYNDSALGTPTVGVNNDPASYETTEAENGAVLVTYANHAYARGWTGKGSTALILDTGIDQDHSEFAGKIKYLWDAGYDTPYEDENGHGTHVAGIVSANKDGTGIHGVAFDTDLAIAKIGSDTGISLSGAKEALNWAKQHDDIVVANLSANTNYSSSYTSSMTDQGNGIFTNDHATYGGSNYYNLTTAQSWKDVIPDELVLVVSAGNTDAGYVQSPATFASATDDGGDLELDGRMLIAGNWNTSTQTIDGAKSGHVCKDYTTQCNDTYKTSDFYLLAPGSNIKSTYLDGEYKNMSGTSMAAPVVTAGVSIVHQMWPYMKGSNIAQVLLQTANKNLADYSVTTHGQGLMDLDKATQPIGTLGISTTGRTGDTASISGSISIDGVDSALVSSVIAVDVFDRDFSVDLSPMVNDTIGSVEQLRHKRGQPWAVKEANIHTRDYLNFTVGTDNEDTHVLGYTHNVNNNLDLNVTLLWDKDSPWVNMTGVWGQVNRTKTFDTSITWSDNDVWAQAGAMHTDTDINTGLVVNIEEAISAYAIAGVNRDDFTFYTGVKPKVINNSKIGLSIPNSVDSNGVMHYSSASNNYGTSTVAFVGAGHTFYFNEENEDVSVSLTTDIIADANDNHSFNGTFVYKF